MLSSRGVFPDPPFPGISSCADSHEFTALHYAARHGSAEMIECLLSAKADVLRPEHATVRDGTAYINVAVPVPAAGMRPLNVTVEWRAY